MNFPQFQPAPLPTPGGVHPIQIPQRFDPASIIMQAAALKQERDLSEQRMNMQAVQTAMEGLQSAQNLMERKHEADTQNQIAQQNIDIAKGRIPLEQAQTRLLQLQGNMMASGIGAPFYNSQQAAQMIAGPDAKASQVQSIQDSLNKAYPNGIVPKDYAHQMAMSAHFNIGQATKTGEFQQKQWEDLNNESPLAKGNRSPVGLAAINNQRLNNILPILTDPNATDQTLHQAVLAIGTVMNGGNPGEQEVAQQMYPTIQSSWNKFMTNLTSSPQIAKQPGVQLQLLGVANQLKQNNDAQLNSYFEGLRSANQSLIASDPARYLSWENANKSSYSAAAPSMGTPQSNMPNIPQTPGPGAGGITIRSSDGRIWPIRDQAALSIARQRDPGLQVISQ